VVPPFSLGTLLVEVNPDFLGVLEEPPDFLGGLGESPDFLGNLEEPAHREKVGSHMRPIFPHEGCKDLRGS